MLIYDRQRAPGARIGVSKVTVIDGPFAETKELVGGHAVF